MNPENLLREWSRLLITSLADAGLTDVVISPGSRSTPLVWAALNCSRLHCHSVLDERSAAFFAVGRAKVTGRPTAVLCTSGSAAANYFPAVVEASLSAVPLLLLTADRPYELHDSGASQTLDQVKLYGGFVRSFVDLGMPESSDVCLTALRRRAAQAMWDTISGDPGPVHLNVRARKPLEPAEAASAAGKDLSQRVDALLATPIPRPIRAVRTIPDVDLEALAAACANASRGLIVCGPMDASAGLGADTLERLAAATGFPVFAETTSQLRFDSSHAPHSRRLDALDVLLRCDSVRQRFSPDLVLQIGAAPTSTAFERWIGERRNVPRHVIASHGYPDPQGTATTLMIGDVRRIALGLADRRAKRGPTTATAWSEILGLMNDASWAAVGELLATERTLSEGTAVRTAVESLPPRGLLGIGNSLPVRHADAFCRSATRELFVFSQRGASGIDGVISGAAGAANASREPTLLVLGDLSTLHDLGGFAVAAALDVPFVVVVLNNDGGRIFEQLPLADTGIEDAAFRFWTTPHGRNFQGVASLFDVDYRRASTIDELRRAADAGLARPGCTVIEVPLAPHGSKEQYRELTRRVERAVAPLVDSLPQ
ncbi:MAG TPA: 2-succinyl-5-enolpyruvyl-6-hydroxy-3-cyclohexene-1-carboxylic-acid synthase [Polyangiaceae bacterium]|jgi:2-succinyl-5-enolpyruvyl-6-hydroxy-3-cyclohexene-1-carboxylate synthase|nr:2-succinyl-5-enolpyruvyl-6-hydroxy-3-cyclohexene-1-carboxylic-acid synthase [Polyangiaceae bacterium]